MAAEVEGRRADRAEALATQQAMSAEIEGLKKKVVTAEKRCTDLEREMEDMTSRHRIEVQELEGIMAQMEKELEKKEFGSRRISDSSDRRMAMTLA